MKIHKPFLFVSLSLLLVSIALIAFFCVPIRESDYIAFNNLEQNAHRSEKKEARNAPVASKQMRKGIARDVWRKKEKPYYLHMDAPFSELLTEKTEKGYSAIEKMYSVR